MSKKKWKPMTAAESLAEMRKNPEFVKREQQRELELELKMQKSRQIQAQLLFDLREVGVEIESVWDLLKTRSRYPQAYPILVDHLCRAYDRRTLEGIVRALTRPDAQCAWDILLRLFLADDDRTTLGLKWAIANAMSIIMLTAPQVEQVLQIVRDPRHGQTRGVLVSQLFRLLRPDLEQILEELKADPELAPDVARARKDMAKLNKRRARKRK